jgi:hypothetical protein
MLNQRREHSVLVENCPPRRLEAMTGDGALRWIRQRERLLREIAATMKSSEEGVQVNRTRETSDGQPALSGSEIRFITPPAEEQPREGAGGLPGS